MHSPTVGAQPPDRDGGYDAGYRSCPCFWGRAPGSVLRWLHDKTDLRGADVLDLGCGEGKNAAWLSTMGCQVTAVDISKHALQNARRAWPESTVHWIEADAASLEWAQQSYDLVIAYGLLHCLGKEQVPHVIQLIQQATRPHGINVIVAFNNRNQDLSAHPGFNPTLLSHQYFLLCYADWELLLATDEDLTETHPHNNIEHTHSMTRIAARRPRD